MQSSPRSAPVVLAGFCAFLNLFLTQPILPLLASIFGASKATVSLTVTAATLGVALAAPFTGQIADRLGRKPVILWSAALLGVTTLLGATAPTLNWLIFWRFCQGLTTPGVFAVAVAYINDEWPAEKAASAAGAYVSGTVVGGFSRYSSCATGCVLIISLVLACASATVSRPCPAYMPDTIHTQRSYDGFHVPW